MKQLYLIRYTIDEYYLSLSEFSFENKSDADRAAKGISFDGSDGAIKSIPVYSSFEEYQASRVENTRRKVLAKLTEEEKKVLGL